MIEVRKYIEADRLALREIYLSSRQQVFWWMDPSALAMNDFDRDTEGEAIWVAEKDGNVAGFISIWEPENFIHAFFVAPDSTGCGIGTSLLEVCLGEIGRPASLKCSEPNKDAKAFYLSKGWKVVTEGEGPDGKYYLMHYDR